MVSSVDTNAPPPKNRVGGNQNPPGHQLSAELSKPDFQERGGSCFDAEMRGMNGDRAWRSEGWAPRAQFLSQLRWLQTVRFY